MTRASQDALAARILAMPEAAAEINVAALAIAEATDAQLRRLLEASTDAQLMIVIMALLGLLPLAMLIATW